jgi:hypothetical protein
MQSVCTAPFATRGAVVAAAALLLAGCGGGSSASPQPKVNADDSPSSSAPSGPNLHYPEQLDASPYVQHLCSALTSSQIRKLIGSKPDNGKHVSVPSTGRGCNWQPASSDAESNSIAIVWLTKGHGGLEFLYSIRNERKYFQPTSVSGFPAVNTSGHDETSSGECVINVGVNNQRYFFAQYQPGPTASNYSNPCPEARQAAKYVIQNLKGGA